MLFRSTWGQGWHNNHHAKASAYDFGTTTSGNRLEWDPSLIFVPLIATSDSRKKILEGRKNAMANLNNQS